MEVKGKEVKWTHTQHEHLRNINKNGEEFVMGPCSEDHDLLMVSLPKSSSVTSLHVYLCNTLKAINERPPGQSVASVSVPTMIWVIRAPFF